MCPFLSSGYSVRYSETPNAGVNGPNGLAEAGEFHVGGPVQQLVGLHVRRHHEDLLCRKLIPQSEMSSDSQPIARACAALPKPS
jgi:hypothetical protein